jgi:uracil-DNA glycosylase
VFLGILKHRGVIPARAGYRFAHGAEVELPQSGMHLFGVYHPSQQNTQTGLLTPAMYATVLRRIQSFLKKDAKANVEAAEKKSMRTQRRVEL